MNRSLASYSPWSRKELDMTEVTSVNPKGNQSWIFTGRTDADAPILWPLHLKNWLIGKDPDAGKDWRQEEKGTTEMVGWHHQLDGHEFEQALGVDGQGSLACCSPWATKSRALLIDLSCTHTCMRKLDKLLNQVHPCGRHPTCGRTSCPLTTPWVIILLF